jgi:hypothetical protein
VEVAVDADAAGQLKEDRALTRVEIDLDLSPV